MSPLSNLQADWPAINRLLDQALELPASERASWLAALPADAEGLKDTVASLLAASGGKETGDFLKTLPKLNGPGQTALDTDAQPGAEVGPWRLLREIGEGGMGSVWLAERADGSLKRRVALKLPRLSWQRGLAERMARERDILATLEHPHIARLYDAGVDALGRPWLALEYVHGQPIDEHVRARALGVRQRVQLLLQVCDAVAYAHSRLVIHRDLKPSNILVTDDGHVCLLDFGIGALVSAAGSAAQATLTAQAGRPLTPAYASPEQILGEPLGTGSDIYSLGVVAYELLTEARPYRLKRDSAAELEEAVAQAEVTAPSSIAQQPGRRDALRGDLDAILMRALQKRPAERYATVDALRRDLASHLAGGRVEARPDRLALRATRWARRHRWPLGIATAVAAPYAVAFGAGAMALTVTSLLAGLAAAAWQARRARQRAREAEVAARRAEAVQDYLQGLFRANSAFQSDPEKARQTTARELLDIGASTLHEALRDQPRAQRKMALTLADMYHELGMTESATALQRRAVGLAEAAEGEHSELLLKALMRLVAELNHTSGGQDERRAAGDRVAAIVQRHHLQPSALRAEAWTMVAQSRRGQDARVWAERAVAEAEAVGAVEHARAAHEIAGQHCYMAAEIDLAAAHFARALELHEKQPPNERHEAATVFIRTGLGECRLALLQPAAGEAALSEAVRIARRTMGENRIDHLQTRLRRARVVAARGRNAEALTELQAVFDVAESPATADPFCAMSALLDLGNLQTEAGLVDAALATLEQAVRRADSLRAQAPPAALARERLAMALLQARRPADALLQADQAEAVRRTLATPDDSPAWLPIVHARASAALQSGRWADAQALLGAAMKGDSTPTTLTALRTRIVALQTALAAGDDGGAARHAEVLSAWVEGQPAQDELPHPATEIDLAAGEVAWRQGQVEQARQLWGRAQTRIARTALGAQGQWRTFEEVLSRCGESAPAWTGPTTAQIH